MVATRMFSANAVGFITSGATPTRAIAARYPEAPACPTDEYRSAAAKIRTASKITCSIAGHPKLFTRLRGRGVLRSSMDRTFAAPQIVIYATRTDVSYTVGFLRSRV